MSEENVPMSGFLPWVNTQSNLVHLQPTAFLDQMICFMCILKWNCCYSHCWGMFLSFHLDIFHVTWERSASFCPVPTWFLSDGYTVGYLSACPLASSFIYLFIFIWFCYKWEMNSIAGLSSCKLLNLSIPDGTGCLTTWVASQTFIFHGEDTVFLF